MEQSEEIERLDRMDASAAWIFCYPLLDNQAHQVVDVVCNSTSFKLVIWLVCLIEFIFDLNLVLLYW